MRHMTKVVLSACTVCALGQAQSAIAGNPVPGQNPPPMQPPLSAPQQTPPPIPSDTPTPPPPDTPAPTAQPTDTPAIPPATTPDASPPVDPSAPPLPPDTTATTAPPPVPATDTSVTLDDGGIYSYAWYEPLLPSGIGVSTILGGGVAGFTDKQMRATTADLGGLWDLRVTIGSHLPLALELGYVGTATNIDGLPAGNKGTLVGTTAEAALRWNMLPHFAWTPYLFGGAGWSRYDVTQTHVSLSDSGMNDHDNLLVFPMGAGIAWRTNGFVADLRGTFRAATDEDLVLKNGAAPSTSSNAFVPMHTWEAGAALGYEF